MTLLVKVLSSAYLKRVVYGINYTSVNQPYAFGAQKGSWNGEWIS